VELSKLDI